MNEYAAKLITPNDPFYPPLLLEIPHRPSQLFARGVLPIPNRKTIAIVGTRKATTVGIKIAEEISANLVTAGFAIISGLAFGIDAAAHRGAIKAGGKTIAVLGSGIDRIYPVANEKLGLEIIRSGGTIVSEYAEGKPSLPANFLARNRIISGLAEAVVIIEAPERSGALSTAGHAAQQGREVFVVPGPTNHQNYRGSHALIRDGARLVTNAKDILSDLGIITPEDRMVNTNNLNQEETTIISALQDAGMGLNIDKLVELTRLEPQIINTTVAILVIKGLIKEENGLYELWNL
jgi:DNA processing protein